MLHSWDAVEASPRHYPLRSEFFAAPRPDDQIRLPRDYLLRRQDAVLRGALVPAIGENVDATGDFDEFRNPSYS